MCAGSLPLFDSTHDPRPRQEVLGPGAMVLRGLVASREHELLSAVQAVSAAAPFRRMVTPGGLSMSVAMTNCGELGWVSDEQGYRYSALDPESERPWPKLPRVIIELAKEASERAGFADFVPDSCLINRYLPGTKLSLHQDKNEVNFAHPIVSVSLGIAARFLFGGAKRSDKAQPVLLEHGDVVVWGGPDRLRYHGVATIKADEHPLLGAQRINLTLRKAGNDRSCQGARSPSGAR